MNLSEIIKCVNGICNIKDQKIKNIVTDTRKLKKGDLFIALKGNNYDGNDYIEEAIKKGAIACITVKNINSKCIIVKDTYKALYDIGLYLRSKYNIPLIAITGSNGKTTTKELLYNVLSSKYNVLKNESSKNNIIGVSDTLFKLNNKYDLIIMELGTNQMGEINTLSNMCKPTLSIITNIGSSHLEYFKTRKNIFKEKYSIVNGMNNINLIVNGDSKYLKRLDCFKCGINSNNDLIAYNIKEDLDNVSFDIKLDKEYNIKFNNPGRHFINDILLVIKVSLIYGIDIQTIINKINSFKLIEKRMNIIPKDSNVIINDCYNASYESVCAGLSYLFNIKSKKVLILADILELGKHSKKIHKKINKRVKTLKNYEVYTVGNYSKYISGKHFKNVSDLINYIKVNEITNSYIYVKGSRRMNLDLVVNYLLM